MTEIPEHLLKRAKERRAAMSGGGDAAPETPAAGGEAAAPAAAAPQAPAKAKSTAPLPTLDAEPAKARADIPVVAAAKNRKRVPYWAASVLALLPLWGFVYYNSVRPAPQPLTDPMVIGAEVFAVSGGCAGCHGGDGAGTAGGAQLNEGHTIETFADPLDMVHWVAYGWAEGRNADDTYGDVKRPRVAGTMPGFRDSLTPEELASVVIYVRSAFGGDAYDPETEQGFTAEAFEADPEALIAQVEAVIELGAGAPDTSQIERAAE